jgi:hypothetical protein
MDGHHLQSGRTGVYHPGGEQGRGVGLMKLWITTEHDFSTVTATVYKLLLLLLLYVCDPDHAMIYYAFTVA